jgi:hypothetical protein
MVSPAAAAPAMGAREHSRGTDLLEYVGVHGMLRLVVPTHNGQFVALLGAQYPAWREARAELNALPLAAEAWRD